MRKPGISRYITLCLLICCISGQTFTTKAAEVLKIGGTGSALGGVQLLADAFSLRNPAANIVILPSLGSGGGIKALKAGVIDLALSARPLKEKELSPKIRITPYSSTAVVFAGRLKTETNDLSTQQLINIYNSGNATSLDGQRIRLVLRPKKETDSRLMVQYIPGMEDALKKARSIPGIPVAITDQDTAATLEKLPNSLGTIALSLVLSEQRNLKTFSLNGVPANLETIRSSAYPMVKTYYLVTKFGATPAVNRFIDFLKSDAGRHILEENGHAMHFGKALR